ncbi:MAG: hypothetical protein U5K56_16615 [Halioglobus sp.]|nr:hypothetical protein [Halioglobus sp.]
MIFWVTPNPGSRNESKLRHYSGERRVYPSDGLVYDGAMKRVVLHIGTGKTGTSTIQRALYRSRRRLRRRAGADYAAAGLHGNDDSGEVTPAHYSLVEALRDGREAELESIGDYVDKRPEKTVIFSCEDFYHHLEERHVARLAQLFGNHSVTVICYVRRQDEYVESAYRQRIRSGVAVRAHTFSARHTDPACLNEVHANYYRMLNVWARCFGTEAVVVRLFDADRFHGGNLLQDFLMAAGLPDVELAGAGGDRSNEALPAELVAVLRACNEAEVVPREHHTRFVADLRKRFHFDDYPMLNPETRARIMENYAGSNRLLFEQFGIEANWETVETANGAEEAAVNTQRSEQHLLAALCYDSWAERQGRVTPWRLRREIHYALRDLLFYARARRSSAGTPPTTARGAYLQLLRRMILGRMFSPSYYLACNRDIAAKGMDPLEHYLRYGRREGRIAHPVMSAKRARSLAAATSRDQQPYHWELIRTRATPTEPSAD